MAKYVNGKKVAEPITKNIIINVYNYEGVLDKVTTGGFLGSVDMTVDGKVAQGTGSFQGKTYPVEVTVNFLGTVPPQKEYQGNTFVERDMIVNALDYVDLDRAEKLTDEEKATLSAISTKDIHGDVVAYLTNPYITKKDANGKEIKVRAPWTPWLDACQQVDQELELPQMVEVPDYVEVEGHKAIGCNVVADINGARFLFGEGERKHCADGRDLYQFVAAAAVGIFPDGELYYPTKAVRDDD